MDPFQVMLNDCIYWNKITELVHSLFILVMSILLQRISNPRDFVKYSDRKMSFWRKGLIAQKLLLHGKIKKVLSRAQMCSLEQRARNAHDQNEQILTWKQFS